MKTFLEYIEYEDIKQLLADILDIDEEDMADLTIGELKNKKKLLKNPELSDIVATSDNRAAILKTMSDDDATIGSLLDLLTSKDTSFDNFSHEL